MKQWPFCSDIRRSALTGMERIQRRSSIHGFPSRRCCHPEYQPLHNHEHTYLDCMDLILLKKRADRSKASSLAWWQSRPRLVLSEVGKLSSSNLAEVRYREHG